MKKFHGMKKIFTFVNTKKNKQNGKNGIKNKS